MSVEAIRGILEQIKSANGTKHRAELVKKYEHSDMFKRTLEFLLSSQIVTNVSTKKLNKEVEEEFGTYAHIDTFEEYLDYLQYVCTGTHSDIAAIQAFVNKHDDEMQEFLKAVASKSYRMGLTEKSIVKLIPGLIKVFEVMRGKLACEDEIRKIKDDFWITAKHNGIRCLAIVIGYNQIELYTRQGKLIHGLGQIMSNLSELPYGMVYDGEIVLDNPANIPHGDNFRLTAGIVNSKDDNKENLIYHIFDAITIREFDLGQSVKNYGERRIWMDSFIPDKKWVKLSRVYYHGSDKKMISKWTDRLVEANYEGSMINADKPYVCKKTSNILKGKKFLSSTFKVTGLEEGSGKNKGKCGKLIVEMWIDGKRYEVGVGSGLSDAQREEWYKHSNLIVGRLIDVQYFEISSDKKGNLSLQFPTFGGIRYDKDEPDMDSNIEGWKACQE